MGGKHKDVKFVNSQLRAKGIKHGVVQVERSHFIDEDGNEHIDSMHWREDRKHFENPILQSIAGCLVWLRCIPVDPEDMLTIKNWLLWAQWMALICDAGAAVVAVVTFSDVTYCCGDPILNIAGVLPWKTLIRVLTYLYLCLVFTEVYPVIRKGFPFNLVNPVIGFTITFAMFFDDSKFEALLMWTVESMAIICEYCLYRLKIRQTAMREKEIVEVGRKTREKRKARPGEDPDAPSRELSEVRQKFYQLKQEQLNDNTLTWYLGVGCYLNIIMGLLVLMLIIVVSQGGGLCIDDFKVPNPFDLDQVSRCPLCSGVDGTCEVCREDVKQCFYPYS